MSSEYPSLARDARLPYATGHDDEISLIDLWIILIRRARVIAGVLLLCVLLGLGWVLLKPPTYQYEATLQIGQVFKGGSFQPIESAASVLAKIEETYVPLARSRLLSADALGGFKLDVRSPQGSELVVISGAGSPAQQGTYLQLLQAVIEQVQTEQLPRFQAAKNAVAHERESAESQLQQIKAEASLSQGQLKQLDDWTQTLNQRLQAARSDLQALRQQRNDLPTRTSNNSADMQLFALNGDIANLRESVADLQSQLGTQVPAQRNAIMRQLEQNRTDQSAQQAHIQELEARYAALQPTRAVLKPQRLPQVTGASPLLILALAAVLGIMLGVFAAFFTEFLVRANAAMKSSATS